MSKIIAGSLNIDASDEWMKFMPNCFKCLRASGDDLSVVEIVKICSKGVDKVNEANTIAKSRAEQSRAEQSRAEQSRAEQSRADIPWQFVRRRTRNWICWNCMG